MADSEKGQKFAIFHQRVKIMEPFEAVVEWIE
jgi:hypothetical protein